MRLNLPRWLRLATSVAVLLALGGASTAALAAREPAAPLRADPVVVESPVRLAGAFAAAPRRLVTDSVKRYERAQAGEEIEVSLTAYCLRGLTRRDNPVRPGIVAADPRVFPLGSHVEVYVGKRHLGRFLVDDTGGVIKGPKIDVWTPECRDARRFGRRKGKAILVAADAEAAPTPDLTQLLPR